MKIVDRYLAWTVVLYSAMVAAVLLTLGALFTFITQQDDIGVGDYDAGDALVYSLFNVPQQAFELMPIAVLIGSLLGLGALARGSELIVLRSSGVSIARLCGSVALGGLILLALAALLGEVVAPPLQKFARQQKAFSKFADVSFAGSGSAWVKDGNLILSVEEQSGDNLFGGIFLFELDGTRLVRVARATTASVAPAGTGWLLRGYSETRFTEEGTTTSYSPVKEIETRVDPGFIGLAVSEPRQLTSQALLRLIGHQRENRLETDVYEFAFWSRIARTCAIVVVALLAIPFALGPLRSSGAGARMVIGILIGVAFFLLQRTLESGAIVFALDPTLLAWVPTILLSVLTSALLLRAR